MNSVKWGLIGVYGELDILYEHKTAAMPRV